MSGNHPAATHKPLQGCRHAHEAGKNQQTGGEKEEGNVYTEQLKKQLLTFSAPCWRNEAPLKL